VQDYLLMDPRVRQVDGHAMVNEMRQNIELMLRKKKHAVQVRQQTEKDQVFRDNRWAHLIIVIGWQQQQQQQRH